MGGEYQEKIIIADDFEDLLAKYALLQEQQAWEYGHGGYSGTFYEKEDGLELIPGTWEEADAADHCINANEKWGKAYAYYMGEGPAGSKYYVGGWCSS